MPVELIRVFHNGMFAVAEFENGFLREDINGQPQTHFCLNAQSLKTRIANLEKNGADTSVERKALSLVETLEKKADDTLANNE